MARQTSKFTIKEGDLATALEISLERLDEVIAFFDSDPDDEWELRENDHFIYTNKVWGNRIFSTQGAFAIAKYLDSHQPQSIWDKIKEFVTRHREKIRNAFIKKAVIENSSSLVLRNGRHFLSKRDTVAILSTSYARLNKAFDDIRRSESPLQVYIDFDEVEGVRYYSLSGFYRLSQNLSQTLTNADRRAWCGAIDVTGRQAFKAITDAKEKRQSRINKAMKKAKERDKKTCQITLVKQTKQNHNFNLAAHHIFSSSHYPHLAATVDNIITLTQEVHGEFHNWNGGSQKPCTVDDLIEFVCERYPDNAEVMVRLYEVKGMFPQSSYSPETKEPPQLPQQSSAA